MLTGGEGVVPAPVLQAGLSLALRDNTRRRHLLVSGVLGKHVPVRPRTQASAVEKLSALVRERLRARGADPSTAVVLGFAETATGLSDAVATAIDARHCATSTRTVLPGERVLLSFEETHSHATRHHLLVGALPQGSTDVLVLVDDEVTTGSTALALVAAAVREGSLAPDAVVVVAALVDARADAGPPGSELDVVALTGVDADAVARATDVLCSEAAGRARALLPRGPRDRRRAVPLLWPQGLRPRSAAGWTRTERCAVGRAAAAAGEVLDRHLIALGVDGDVLVLGGEEFLTLPAAVAAHLEESGRPAWSSSTTRSPGLVLEEPGYGLQDGVAFPGPVGEGVPRFAYNVRAVPGSSRPFSAIVVLHDATAPHTPGVAAALAEHAPHVLVHSIAVEEAHRPLHGPEFSSYPAEDVSWLLTEIVESGLEAPREDREARLQSGASHYSETLPVEYEPAPEYLRAYERALERNALAVAVAVADLADLVLAERGPGVVLVSLARAGVPVGILLRRWLQRVHSVPAPHFAVSIIRDRGIDTRALDHVLARHPARAVQFVDGWTGKGVIAETLTEAVEDYVRATGAVVDGRLAVLSDPLGVAALRATRADLLIPSACLNSTVSGLVSRTVLNADIVARGGFHGARFYRHLEDRDCSLDFLAAVESRFEEVLRLREDDGGAVVSGREDAVASEPSAVVRAIMERYDVRDRLLLKPGIGETTRVLLRRVPRLVAVHPDHLDALQHLLVLAEERGVAVVSDPLLPFACVGVIAQGGGR